MAARKLHAVAWSNRADGGGRNFRLAAQIAGRVTYRKMGGLVTGLTQNHVQPAATVAVRCE